MNLQKIWPLDFRYNLHATSLRSLIIPRWRVNWNLEFPLFKFRFFQYSGYLFPKVFSCHISWNSKEEFSRKRRISKKAILIPRGRAPFGQDQESLTKRSATSGEWEKAIPHSIAITHALHLIVFFRFFRTAGFFASLPFLAYHQSIHCVQWWKKKWYRNLP